MAAIATKDLGINPLTGLSNKVAITSITIDSKNELITIVYSVETISPTGVVVSSIDNNTYIRKNEENNEKYNNLKNSVVGQMITGMLITDLNLIQSVETINEDLKQ